MNSNANYLLANEGRTLLYLIPAVLLALIAIPFFFFFIPISFLLIAMTVLLTLVESGLELNTDTMQYRKFKSLFGNKWGQWKSLVDPSGFHLNLSVERSYRNNAFSSVASTSWNGSSTEIARSVTYDFSYDSSTSNRTIIYEFLDYDVAKKLVKQLSEITTIEVTNHIAIKLQENRQKRMNRR